MHRLKLVCSFMLCRFGFLAYLILIEQKLVQKCTPSYILCYEEEIYQDVTRNSLHRTRG